MPCKQAGRSEYSGPCVPPRIPPCLQGEEGLRTSPERVDTLRLMAGQSSASSPLRGLGDTIMRSTRSTSPPLAASSTGLHSARAASPPDPLLSLRRSTTPAVQRLASLLPGAAGGAAAWAPEGARGSQRRQGWRGAVVGGGELAWPPRMASTAPAGAHRMHGDMARSSSRVRMVAPGGGEEDGRGEEGDEPDGPPTAAAASVRAATAPAWRPSSAAAQVRWRAARHTCQPCIHQCTCCLCLCLLLSDAAYPAAHTKGAFRCSDMCLLTASLPLTDAVAERVLPTTPQPCSHQHSHRSTAGGQAQQTLRGAADCSRLAPSSSSTSGRGTVSPAHCCFCAAAQPPACWLPATCPHEPQRAPTS